MLYPAWVSAQEESPAQNSTNDHAIKLFIDCSSGCDMNYIREHIPYVNFVRDVHEAELYLLITRQNTGSGGRNYTLFFSGQQRFAAMADTIDYYSNPDDTSDIIREGITKTIALGLIRFVAKTPMKDRVLISYLGEPQAAREQVTDEWNFWVFQVELSPDIQIEQRNKEFSWEFEIDINRVTPDWKLENEFQYDHETEIFIRDIYDDATGEYKEIRTEAITKSWDIENLTVKSITDHWSAGLKTDIQSSSYRNIRFRTSFAPAVEYNIFPYSEYNRRELTILYDLGYVYNSYVDTTIYNKMEETLYQQSLDIRLRLQQRWGYSSVSLNSSTFLHDFQKYYVSLNGYISVRIFKGFSLSLRGSMAFINNQIELPKGNRTDEEVFLRLKELETNYRYSLGVGLNYSFGSIYSNIVNPRF